MLGQCAQLWNWPHLFPSLCMCAWVHACVHADMEPQDFMGLCFPYIVIVMLEAVNSWTRFSGNWVGSWLSGNKGITGENGWQESFCVRLITCSVEWTEVEFRRERCRFRVSRSIRYGSWIIWNPPSMSVPYLLSSIFLYSVPVLTEFRASVFWGSKSKPYIFFP